MKPVLRLLAGLIAVVVLVLVALGAYFAFLFDANDYRDRLVSLVKEQTGRTLTLNGEIKLSLFPWLGLSIGAAELSNAPGFSDRPFASLAAAEARVKLLPLLSNTVAIDRVKVSGLQMSLERRKDGQTNWADLGRSDSTSAPAKDEGESDKGGGGAASLSVGGIDIQNAAIRWVDATQGQEYLLTDVDLSTGAIAPGTPFDFKGGLGFSTAEPAANGRLTLSGHAALDTAAGQYKIDELRAEVDAEGAGLPGGKLNAGLLADVMADLNAGTLTLSGFNMRAYEMQMTGDLAVSSLKTEPTYRGKIAIDGLNPRGVMTALGMAAPMTANAERLKRASLKAGLSGSTTSVALSDIVASLDDSEITGHVDVTDFKRQAVKFDLSISALDVDSYLPPAAAKGSGKPAEQAGSAKAPSAPLDLRGRDVAGRVRIGTLKINGLNLTDVDTHLTLAGGRLELKPKAVLYAGRLDANAVVVAKGKTPTLAINGGVNKVHIDPLLRDLTGKPERLSGVATVATRLAGTGLDADALTQTLAGTVDLKVSNGAVKGVNIAQFLREAQARLQGSAADAPQGTQQTDFTDLTATIKLGGGIARNDDLNLRSPLLRVGGAGSANLVKQRIDYLVKTSLVGTLTGQGGKSLDQVRGVTVPVRVGGTFAQPTYKLDAEALLAEAAKGKLDEQKAKLQEKVKEAREKAKEDIKEELTKGLKGLFK